MPDTSNLPVPSSYRQSLIAHYREVKQRLNSGRAQDLGIKCVSAHVRSAEWRNPETAHPVAQPARAKYWFSIIEEIDAPAIGRCLKIQTIVAKHYGIRVRDILSERRTADIVRPRQVAMWLCRRFTARSLPEIGRRFGGRDHTTVLHAVRKIDALFHKDADLAFEIAGLIAETEKALQE